MVTYPITQPYSTSVKWEGVTLRGAVATVWELYGMLEVAF